VNLYCTCKTHAGKEQNNFVALKTHCRKNDSGSNNILSLNYKAGGEVKK
jgi:hypothetical protein